MVSLIKLTNGTEVVGTIKNDSNSHVLVSNPLQLNYYIKAPGHPPSVSIQRYIPFADSKEIEFKREHIIAVVKPKDGMTNYYNNALRQIEYHVDKMIENELIAAAKDDEPSEEELEVAVAMLERMKGKHSIN